MNKTQRKAHEAKMAALREQAIAIVSSGKCPLCGSGLHRNNSLAGWYQCNRSGSGHFRQDPTGAACQFQCFTE